MQLWALTDLEKSTLANVFSGKEGYKISGELNY